MAKKKEIGIASTGNVDWSVFLQEGIIISLSIKYYRGVTKVNFDELGIDATGDDKLSEFLGEYIEPGNKCLIPPEIKGQLKSIETTARQNLKDHSFDCSAFSSTGKFVPKSMYRDFKEVNDELMERFYDIRDDFVDNYERIIEHVRKDYSVLAGQIYMQSHPAAKRPAPKFVNQFVDAIVGQIASPEEILASFEYKTTMQVIPEYLLRVISQKSNIDARVMKIAASNTPELAASAKKAVAAKAKADAEHDDELDEMQRDIEETMTTQAEEQAADFIEDIQMTLCTQAADGADNVIKSIDRNNGKLVGRASVQARSLVSGIRGKSYGDPILESKVAELEKALGKDAKTRDVAAVREAALSLYNWSQDSMAEIHSKSVERKVASAPDRRRRKTDGAAPKTKAGLGKEKAKFALPINTKRRTIKKRNQ